MANKTIPDLQAYIQAGIDPKTGLPVKFSEFCSKSKDEIKKNLRILDEQNAITRFKWYNLPNGLTSELMERILYYRGQGAFFKMNDGKFYFLPYALSAPKNSTGIDVYGRYTGITPLPFNGTAKTGEKTWITGLIKKPIYDMLDVDINSFEEGCVLIHDYTPQASQMNIPRYLLQDQIIDSMAEAFPMCRTSLIANSGIKMMRVANANDSANVAAAVGAVQNCALNGVPFIPVIGSVEFQDLTSGGTALKAEEYLIYMQALDNFRLSLYGLKNGGLFQKKAHMLESEQEMNNGNTLMSLQNALNERQNACDLINANWGLGIYVEASESALGFDTNGNGWAGDTQDQTGIPGEQPEMEENDNV